MSQEPPPTRVLHVGLHKSGSTFLQRVVFPALSGVNYLGNFSLSGFIKNGDPANSGIPLISSEACLGFPYPITTGPNYNRLDYLIDLLGISHAILVTRDFESWVRSLYFQVLKEGGTISYKKWYRENKNLELWREVESVLKVRMSKRGIRILILSQEDLIRDKSAFLDRLCEFVGTSSPNLPNVSSQNRSRYGNVTLELARWSNVLIPNGLFHQTLRRFKIDPRDQLLFGQIGAITEKISWRQLPKPSALKSE